jgi:hypothetical protein
MTHVSLKSVLGLAGVLVVICAVAWPGYSDGAARPAKERQWSVPVRTRGHGVSMWAAGDGKRVFVSETSMARGKDGRIKRSTRLVMLETGTGKCTDLVKSLAKVVRVSRLRSHLPSPDGKHVLFVDSPAEESRSAQAWLFNIDSGKARMLAAASHISPIWGGAKLYLSCVDATDKIGPVRVFDTSGKKLRTLKICGLVSGADAKGKLLVCLHNPNELDQALLGLADIRNAELGLFTLESNPYADIAPLKKIPHAVIFSPGSKYLAVQDIDLKASWGMAIRGASRADRATISHLLVMKIGDKQTRRITGVEEPLFVSDTGSVIAASVRGGADRHTVKMWDPKGAVRTLARDVKLACVSGNTLYYLTRADKPKLRAVPIKLDQ